MRRQGVARNSTHGQSDPNLLLLQDLGDDLLIEILSRIPTIRLAFRCKLVCKRWCSLICNPYFTTSFIAHKPDKSDQYQKLLAVVASNFTPESYNRKNPEFNLARFNLDFLPLKRGSVFVEASCNDLILCRAGNYRETNDYYLCNPFTMQWVSLPSPSQVTIAKGHRTTFGLICEHGGGIDVNSEYRYRVVRLYYREVSQFRGTRVAVETYYSDTGQWVQSELLGTEYSIVSKAAALNGKLHWAGLLGRYLVTYDPFNKGNTSVIDGPDLSLPNAGMGWQYIVNVGECNGGLRFLRIVVHSRDVVCKDLRIWDLEEDFSGQNNGSRLWSLKHTVDFGPTFLRFKEINKDFTFDMYLKFHPTNKDLLLLESGGILASYNMESEELKAEGIGHVGECNGVLRVMRMEFHYDRNTICMDISVWDLEEESEQDNGRRRVLSLKHNVGFRSILLSNSCASQIIWDFSLEMYLAFHPNNRILCTLDRTMLIAAMPSKLSFLRGLHQFL